MSSVGGVGGIGGMGALGANISVGAISTGGLNGPLGNVNAAAMSALSATRMGQLLELIDGFSSAEILIALMMAGGNRRKHDCGDDTAMGLLLGLAMASQMGQQQLQMPAPCGVSAAATGGQINLVA